jgi:predicted GTPase
VLVVLDARHGIKVNDREMLKFLSAANVKFQLVLNKTDMVRPADLARRMQVASEEMAALKGANEHVHAVSTSTGAGIAALSRELYRLTSSAGATSAASALPRRDALVAQGLMQPDVPQRRPPRPAMREAVAPPVREP